MDLCDEQMLRRAGPRSPLTRTVRLYAATNGWVAISTATPTNRSTNNGMNGIDHGATRIWHALSNPPVFTWLEHPATGSLAIETYDWVRFERTPQARLVRRGRQTVAGTDVAALLAGLTLPLSWSSLPPPGQLQVVCRGCGRALAVSAVLRSASVCTRCSAGRPERPRAPGVAWSRRVPRTAHARWGLTRPQCATLLVALLAGRSLWALTAGEVVALEAQMAAFPSRAAVEAFLATQPQRGGGIG